MVDSIEFTEYREEDDGYGSVSATAINIVEYKGRKNINVVLSSNREDKVAGDAIVPMLNASILNVKQSQRLPSINSKTDYLGSRYTVIDRERRELGRGLYYHKLSCVREDG